MSKNLKRAKVSDGKRLGLRNTIVLRQGLALPHAEATRQRREPLHSLKGWMVSEPEAQTEETPGTVSARPSEAQSTEAE